MSSRQIIDLLLSQISAPLTLIDVGAAGGALEGWQQFGEKARVICFEARENEATYLAVGNTATNIEYVPLALAADDRGIELNVTVNQWCSSVYPPIERIYKRYPGNVMLLRPIVRVTCPSIALDKFLENRGIDRVHAIKLDTQGSELDILRNAERALENCLFLIIECEFNALYEGQPLFCDVDRFLRDRGFVLWRFDNLAHYSTGQIGGDPHSMQIGSDPGGHHNLAFANGQLFWANGLYVRATATPVSDNSLPFDEAVAGAALVAQWNLWDLVVEMIRKSGNEALVSKILSLLDSTFVEPRPSYRYYAEEFRSELLPVQLSCIETDFSQQNPIIYGPYVPLPWGEQEVTFHVRTIDLTDELLSTITFDVAQDYRRIAEIHLIGTDGAQILRSGEVKLRFWNGTPKALFEFRIFINGRPFAGKLMFYGVSVRPLTK